MRKGDPVKEGDKTMVASDRHPTSGWFTPLEMTDYKKIM
jgi:hypothetical protein